MVGSFFEGGDRVGSIGHRIMFHLSNKYCVLGRVVEGRFQGRNRFGRDKFDDQRNFQLENGTRAHYQMNDEGNFVSSRKFCERLDKLCHMYCENLDELRSTLSTVPAPKTES